MGAGHPGPLESLSQGLPGATETKLGRDLEGFGGLGFREKIQGFGMVCA